MFGGVKQQNVFPQTSLLLFYNHGFLVYLSVSSSSPSSSSSSSFFLLLHMVLPSLSREEEEEAGAPSGGVRRLFCPSVSLSGRVGGPGDVT